jgi:hypothetical protein
MNEELARQILKDTLLHVDFVNMGRVISALGEDEFTWKTFDNSKWRPNKNLALREAKWLQDNANNIFEALRYLKENK